MGEGSYGIVYALREDPRKAAKVYKPSGLSRIDRSRRSQKLERMTEMPIPDAGPKATVAWPEQVLTLTAPGEQHDGYADGYVMARAPSERISIATLNRLEHGSEQARYAADVIEQAVKNIHQSGFVIGDINGNNFALSQDGVVWIFDTDSWQFKDSQGFLHYAQGATDHYTHPSIFERMSGSLPNCTDPNCTMADRTHRPTPSCQPRQPWHDRHGISVMTRELRKRRR